MLGGWGTVKQDVVQWWDTARAGGPTFWWAMVGVAVGVSRPRWVCRHGWAVASNGARQRNNAKRPQHDCCRTARPCLERRGHNHPSHPSRSSFFPPQPPQYPQPPTNNLNGLPPPWLLHPQTSACALSGALGSAAPLPALLRTGLLQHLLAALLLILLSVCVAHAQHCTCVLSQAARRRSVQLLVVAVAGGLWALGWLRPEGAGPLGQLAVGALAARALGPPFALLLAVVS